MSSYYSIQFPVYSIYMLWLGLVCLAIFTTGNLKFAECFYVCRVHFLGHLANKFFVECCSKNKSHQKLRTTTLTCPITTGNVKFAECFYVCRVYSLGHSANKFFAECCAKNTRQKKTLGKEKVCRVSKKKHSAKMGFTECFF